MPIYLGNDGSENTADKSRLRKVSLGQRKGETDFTAVLEGDAEALLAAADYAKQKNISYRFANKPPATKHFVSISNITTENVDAIIEKLMELREREDFKKLNISYYGPDGTPVTYNLNKPAQKNANGKTIKKTADQTEQERETVRAELTKKLSKIAELEAKAPLDKKRTVYIKGLAFEKGNHIVASQFNGLGTYPATVTAKTIPETVVESELYIEGIKDKNIFLQQLQEKGLFNPRRDAKGQIISASSFAETEGNIFQKLKAQWDYDTLYNSTAASGQRYTIGNLIQTFSSILSGNTNEALAGIAFAWTNIINSIDTIIRGGRSADELVTDMKKDLAIEADGRVTPSLGKENIHTRRQSGLGRVVDSVWSWLRDNKNDNVFGLKILSNLYAGYSTLRAGLTGRLRAERDENGDPIIGKDGLAVKTRQRDLAPLVSGPLILGAYVSALLPPRYRDGEALIGHGGLLDKKAAVSLGNAIEKGAYQLRGHGAVGDWAADQYQALTDSPMTQTGNLMKLHNYNMIGSSGFRFLQERFVVAPEAAKKAMAERLTYFGKDSKANLLQDYVGEKGIFGNRFDALLDDNGFLRDDVRKAKDEIVAKYAAMEKELAKLQKKHHKKGEEPPRIKELKAELKAGESVYDKSLFLGCYDDKSHHSKGVLGIGKHDSDATRYISRYTARLHDRAHPFDPNSEEVFRYKSALKKFDADNVRNLWWVPLARMVYSTTNISGANFIKQMSQKGKILEINEATQRLDKTNLYEQCADFLMSVVGEDQINTLRDRIAKESGSSELHLLVDTAKKHKKRGEGEGKEKVAQAAHDIAEYQAKQEENRGVKVETIEQGILEALVIKLSGKENTLATSQERDALDNVKKKAGDAAGNFVDVNAHFNAAVATTA